MKKSWMNRPSAKVIFALTCLLGASAVFSTTSVLITVYNTIIQSKARVNQTVGNLESVYQRRYALVENFVLIVNATKEFEQYQITIEKELYPRVAEAKAKATQLNIQLPQEGSQRIQNESRLNATLLQALDKLLVLAQHYPTIPDPVLKDRTATFASLADLKNSLSELEGNVQDSRQQVNEAVQAYNQNIQIFPANCLARRWGFLPLTGFEVLSPDARQDVKLKL